MVLCASGLTRLLPKCIDHVTKNSELLKMGKHLSQLRGNIGSYSRPERSPGSAARIVMY